MMSQSWKKTTAMRMLPNMSTSKDKQTMKFGQLTECNRRNIFLEKSHAKYGGETILRPFLKIRI